jgi:type I restriction enzyme R subunit
LDGVYGFLSAVLPRQDNRLDWEKRSIFLTFLVPKLPAPTETDLARGILEAIDMDSYRVEKQTMQRILLPDQDVEIGPVPTPGGGPHPDPELEQLSAIISRFNDLFGNIPWEDGDRLFKRITETIPAKVAADKAFRNAQKYSDKPTARIEFDKALMRVMVAMMKDETQLFKEYMDNLAFRREISDAIFSLTYRGRDSTA